ncbi:MAG: hypothetical protein JO107_16260, partial [Hyphomicrobiales bacterium]|nr:hypothetical protein [Hyphomicrobiales bacterium]
PASAPQGFGFDAFRAELWNATTLEDANATYARVTGGAGLTEDELSECDAILREACARFWSEE